MIMQWDASLMQVWVKHRGAVTWHRWEVDRMGPRLRAKQLRSIRMWGPAAWEDKIPTEVWLECGLFGRKCNWRGGAQLFSAWCTKLRSRALSWSEWELFPFFFFFKNQWYFYRCVSVIPSGELIRRDRRDIGLKQEVIWEVTEEHSYWPRQWGQEWRVEDKLERQEQAWLVFIPNWKWHSS